MSELGIAIENWGFTQFSTLLFSIIIGFILLISFLLNIANGSNIQALLQMFDFADPKTWMYFIIYLYIVFTILSVYYIFLQALKINTIYQIGKNNQEQCGMEYVEAATGNYAVWSALYGKEDTMKHTIESLLYILAESLFGILFLIVLIEAVSTKYKKNENGKSEMWNTMVAVVLSFYMILLIVLFSALIWLHTDVFKYNFVEESSRDIKVMGIPIPQEYWIMMLYIICFFTACWFSYIYNKDKYASEYLYFFMISVIAYICYISIKFRFQQVVKSIDAESDTSYNTHLNNIFTFLNKTVTIENRETITENTNIKNHEMFQKDIVDNYKQANPNETGTEKQIWAKLNQYQTLDEKPHYSQYIMHKNGNELDYLWKLTPPKCP